MQFAVWRLYDDKPGCVDFLKTIEAKGLADAERIAAHLWELSPGERLDIEEDHETLATRPE